MAGILGLVSLVVPLDIVLYRGGLDTNWTVFGVNFYNGGSSTYNVSEYALGDAMLSVLLLILVLVGGILLLAVRNKPRIGAILLASGLALYVLDVVYNEFTYTGYGMPIPVGFFLILAGSVMGLAARPTVPFVPKGSMGMESSADRLLKLKGLLDSGAITTEEYEDQKRKILEAT